MDPISRREVKYALSARALPTLRRELAARLGSDPHNDVLEGRGYWIRSIYFDSPRLQLLDEKLAGVGRRFKLRLRSYPPLEAASPWILEIKHREGPWVRKERCSLSLAEVQLLLRGQHVPFLEALEGAEVARRFVAQRARLRAVVPHQIDYRRQAFVHPNPQVYLRATIDEGLRLLRRADPLAPPGAGTPFAPRSAILEIKTSGPPPSWLGQLVDRYRLDPRSISKYVHGVSSLASL